jgi:UDPglucose 6-dehydrogenase
MTDAALGVEHGLFQVIAVGTPADEEGSSDLAVNDQQKKGAAAGALGQALDAWESVEAHSEGKNSFDAVPFHHG